MILLEKVMDKLGNLYGSYYFKETKLFIEHSYFNWHVDVSSKGAELNAVKGKENKNNSGSFTWLKFAN